MEQHPQLAKVEGQNKSQEEKSLQNLKNSIVKTTRSGREVKKVSVGYTQNCVMNAYTHKKRENEKKNARHKELRKIQTATFRKKKAEQLF